MTIPKISILGAGNVGGAAAAAIATRALGDVYLYDVVPGLAAGKAMDIRHALTLFDSDVRVAACASADEVDGSDIVVITAGRPRRAGMKRRDLFRDNLAVVRGLAEHIARSCPRAQVLVVTNPAEPLVLALRRRWPALNVASLGCTLDAVRFRRFLADAAGEPVSRVDGLVIGSHDDHMVPLAGHAAILGRPVSQVLSPPQIADAVSRTRQAGAAIVAKLKTRGSWYAASHCITAIVKAIVADTRTVLPLGVPCTGQYGHRSTCLALPCELGANGIERVLDLALDDDEREALAVCATEVRRVADASDGNAPGPPPQ